MKKEWLEKNVVLRLAFEFAIDIINFCEILEAERKFVIARQLLRAGTSIGANAMEAQNAESKSDFIHKFKLAAKEAEEAQYWLMLCEQAYHHASCKGLLDKVDELLKLICKILSTSKRRYSRKAAANSPKKET